MFKQAVENVYKSMLDTNFLEPRNRRILLLFGHDLQGITGHLLNIVTTGDCSSVGQMHSPIVNVKIDKIPQ